MILVCAWCSSVYGEKPPYTEPEAVSHGICTNCWEKVSALYGFGGNRENAGSPSAEFG